MLWRKRRTHDDFIREIDAHLAAETDRLLSLGATRVIDVQQGGAHWTTFRDPEGNEFDLVAG